VVRTRTAGMRAFLVGLAAAAVAAGSAAAAVPMVFPVHARLAPVAGTKAPGQFNGVLAQSGSIPQPVQRSAMPINGVSWRLSWKVSLPPLGRPAAVTLRIGARGGAAAVMRVLSAHCTVSAKGTIKLTGSQATRVARGDAVVMVRTPSATLRGTIRLQRPSSS
jgi:hypothetical protein